MLLLASLVSALGTISCGDAKTEKQHKHCDDLRRQSEKLGIACGVYAAVGFAVMIVLVVVRVRLSCKEVHSDVLSVSTLATPEGTYVTVPDLAAIPVASNQMVM